VVSLWTHEVEAHRHTNEAERIERSCKNDEEATMIQREWDELLQRDVMASQRILELLDEVQGERD
jgi:hypothetical protein